MLSAGSLYCWRVSDLFSFSKRGGHRLCLSFCKSHCATGQGNVAKNIYHNICLKICNNNLTDDIIDTRQNTFVFTDWTWLGTGPPVPEAARSMVPDLLPPARLIEHLNQGPCTSCVYTSPANSKAVMLSCFSQTFSPSFITKTTLLLLQRAETPSAFPAACAFPLCSREWTFYEDLSLPIIH